MQLSTHFSLEEFLHSQTAARLGIANEPTTEQIQSMMNLCDNVLEPVRAHFNVPVIIDSGFRCPQLNAAIPCSSNTSQHMVGEAADILIRSVTLTDIYNYIKDNLTFDQIIYEGTWVHVSFKAGANRKQALEATFANGGVTYEAWKETP